MDWLIQDVGFVIVDQVLQGAGDGSITYDVALCSEDNLGEEE